MKLRSFLNGLIETGLLPDDLSEQDFLVLSTIKLSTLQQLLLRANSSIDLINKIDDIHSPPKGELDMSTLSDRQQKVARRLLQCIE